MVEFIVFNVNMNLVSIVIYFYEVFVNGVVFILERIDMFELYSIELGV